MHMPIVMFVSAASDITLCYEIMDNGIMCVCCGMPVYTPLLSVPNYTAWWR